MENSTCACIRSYLKDLSLILKEVQSIYWNAMVPVQPRIPGGSGGGTADDAVLSRLLDDQLVKLLLLLRKDISRGLHRSFLPDPQEKEVNRNLAEELAFFEHVTLEETETYRFLMFVIEGVEKRLAVICRPLEKMTAAQDVRIQKITMTKVILQGMGLLVGVHHLLCPFQNPREAVTKLLEFPESLISEGESCKVVSDLQSNLVWMNAKATMESIEEGRLEKNAGTKGVSIHMIDNPLEPQRKPYHYEASKRPGSVPYRSR